MEKGYEPAAFWLHSSCSPSSSWVHLSSIWPLENSKKFPKKKQPRIQIETKDICPKLQGWQGSGVELKLATQGGVGGAPRYTPTGGEVGAEMRNVRPHKAGDTQQSRAGRWEGERKGGQQSHQGSQLRATRGGSTSCGCLWRGVCHPHIGAGRGDLVNKPSWLFCLSTLSVLTCAVPNLRVLLFNK